MRAEVYFSPLPFLLSHTDSSIQLMTHNFIRILFSILLGLAIAQPVSMQTGGGNILYGDLKVDEGNTDTLKPISFDVLLYNSGYVIARQTVASNGSYRFNDLGDGDYDLVVELENSEIARMRIHLRSPIVKTDFRHDITLAWKSIHISPGRPVSVSVDDFYARSSENQKLFSRAQEATDNKKYDEALGLLNQLVANDINDFQAWSELGTVRLIKQDLNGAEKAYELALERRPAFFLALMNLGRLKLMRKDYDATIPILTRAVVIKPNSADANFYLGEAYLQIKKGSKAVGYLYEALKLDPIGKAEAHLRLAALYNAAGLKDKAAEQYEAFLKKKPEYPDRKRLKQYISANKKN